MAVRHSGLAFVTVLALGLAAPALAANTAAGVHAHGAAGATSALTLDHGRKWQTDAALRQGMSTVRADISGALDAIHHGTLPDKDYATLADRVAAQIDFMIENCKLPPDADAQLHLVLEQMLEGADAMRTGERQAGAVTVAGALNAYGDHFDHPGWTALPL